jgi:hypothetical protein
LATHLFTQLHLQLKDCLFYENYVCLSFSQDSRKAFQLQHSACKPNGIVHGINSPFVFDDHESECGEALHDITAVGDFDDMGSEGVRTVAGDYDGRLRLVLGPGWPAPGSSRHLSLRSGAGPPQKHPCLSFRLRQRRWGWWCCCFHRNLASGRGRRYRFVRLRNFVAGGAGIDGGDVDEDLLKGKAVGEDGRVL